jgi:hypothetical protein
MTGGNIRCTKASCFQNHLGKECKLLSSPIKNHECPFYKTQEKVDAERKTAHELLFDIGRIDLIEKYEYNTARRGQW